MHGNLTRATVGSSDAETIGAASNHAALNLANALGAWLGGLEIAAGCGYQAASWVGVALSLGGLVFLGASLLLHRKGAAQVTSARMAA